MADDKAERPSNVLPFVIPEPEPELTPEEMEARTARVLALFDPPKREAAKTPEAPPSAPNPPEKSPDMVQLHPKQLRFLQAINRLREQGFLKNGYTVEWHGPQKPDTPPQPKGETDESKEKEPR